MSWNYYNLRRAIPKPTCPTCGQTNWARHYALLHGRAVVHPTGAGWRGMKYDHTAPTTKPIRVSKRKYKVVHTGAGTHRQGRGVMSRSYAMCNDPFHDYVFPEDQPKPPERGRLGHNPDLRAAKDLLSRDLQGKARR